MSTFDSILLIAAKYGMKRYPCTFKNALFGSYNWSQHRLFNSNRTSIARIGRKIYTRMYPTLLVQPDGSTIMIRYPVPQKIIKLPIDISKLSENQKLALLERRKPKQKVVVQEEVENDFDVDKYSHLWKK